MKRVIPSHAPTKPVSLNLALLACDSHATIHWVSQQKKEKKVEKEIETQRTCFDGMMILIGEVNFEQESY